jgi:hypothetical protein
MRLGVLVPYSEEMRVVKRRVVKLFIFKKEVEEIRIIGKGTRYEDVRKIVKESIKSGYGSIGHLRDEPFSDIVNIFGGNKGDGIKGCNWYPWDVDIETDVCATWADEYTDVTGNFISIGGYGNPAVSGNEFLTKMMKCKFIETIVEECGIHIDIPDSNFVIHLNGKTILARLSV